MKRVKKGDRVRYYGAYNEYMEVTGATVLKVKGDALYLSLDRHMYDGGDYRTGGECCQWAHRKQCRKLKAK